MAGDDKGRRSRRRPNLLDQKDFTRHKITTRSGKDLDVFVDVDTDDAADVLGLFYAQMLEQIRQTLENAADKADGIYTIGDIQIEIGGDIELSRHEGSIIFRFKGKDKSIRLGSVLRARFIKRPTINEK